MNGSIFTGELNELRRHRNWCNAEFLKMHTPVSIYQFNWRMSLSLEYLYKSVEWVCIKKEESVKG